MDPFNSPAPQDIEVIVDGLAVEIPPGRGSLAGIRSYIEWLALQQQRILCSLTVDGELVSLTRPRQGNSFARVEAETMSLDEVPVQLIGAAIQQTAAVRARAQSAVELVLINEAAYAKELWWNLATGLKEPLLTLSLLPETMCGSTGGASLMQLRKWQLQQLGCVVHDVDEASNTDDPAALSDALEKRVLPWLDNLHESLRQWHEMISTDSHAAAP